VEGEMRAPIKFRVRAIDLEQAGIQVSFINTDNLREIRKSKENVQILLKALNWSWQCNECGSNEFTSSVSEDDLEYLSCTGCGGTEFHKESA
jgi:Zn finger protein HypA/HybF involved in hydrogenase expression